MTARSDRLLIGGALSIFVFLLLGILVWTSLAKDVGSPDTPFTLQGTHGQIVDQTSFRGQASLVYFGYTHCPELCPTTLADMTNWLETLGDDGADLQALFFTIDPERDSLEAMQSYVANFSDRIVGVTGNTTEMRKFADAWLITADVNSSGDSYSVSHTASVLLIGPDGKVAGMIPYGTDPGDAVAKIRQVLLDTSSTQS